LIFTFHNEKILLFAKFTEGLRLFQFFVFFLMLGLHEFFEFLFGFLVLLFFLDFLCFFKIVSRLKGNGGALFLDTKLPPPAREQLQLRRGEL